MCSKQSSQDGPLFIGPHATFQTLMLMNFISPAQGNTIYDLNNYGGLVSITDQSEYFAEFDHQTTNLEVETHNPPGSLQNCTVPKNPGMS